MKQQRIGIFSGVFDPIHAGHIGFALAAAESAKLDVVYFLIESSPRRKIEVTHPAHRIAMAKLALEAHSKLKLLELPDKQLSVAKTLPRLNQHFSREELVFLAGSDMLHHMPSWPLIDRLLSQMELVVGTKGDSSINQIKTLIKSLPGSPKALFVINSPNPDISSKNIRQQLQKGVSVDDLLPSVDSYIKKHWLYASPSVTISSS